MPDSRLQDVQHLIQLSVAPVFLLTAAGTTLSVLVTRLGRIVDRGRALEKRVVEAIPGDRSAATDELRTVAQRARLIHLAITSAASSALFVCLLIAAAFVGFLFGAHLAWALAVLFVCATSAFAVGLLFLLREVFLAIRHFRLKVPDGAPPSQPG